MTEIAIHTSIRLRRKQRGLRQRELADKLGRHVRQIIRWENGDAEPDEASRTALARVLGGKPDDYKVEREKVEDHEREFRRLRATNRDLARRLEEIETLVAQLLRD